jgi:hypothetical protein
MEPLKPIHSPVEFINILRAYSRVTDNHHVVKIVMDNIPDSICFNNPYIKKGYSEFAIDVIYRNKHDSINRDNIVFSLGFNNFEETDSTLKCDSFQNFIDNCEASVQIVKEDLNDSTVVSPYYKNIKTDLEVIIDSNAFVFKTPKQDLCKYYEKYLTNGFLILATYNDAQKRGENNYYTTNLSSDRWVRHTFLHNSSRRFE